MDCVKVILRNATPSFDRVYTYEVPKNLVSEAIPGRRVLFPFGRSNRLEEGFIFAKADDTEAKGIKKISACLDAYPLLLPDQLRLIAQMKLRYSCTYGQAVSVMLPAGAKLQMSEEIALTEIGLKELPSDFLAHWGQKDEKIPLADLQLAGFGRGEIYNWEREGYLVRSHQVEQKIKSKTVEYCRLADPEAAVTYLEEQTLGSIQQEEAVRFLLAEGEVTVSDLLQACSIRRGTLRTLQKKNLLLFERKPYVEETVNEEARQPSETSVAAPGLFPRESLTTDQAIALEAVEEALAEEWQPGNIPKEFLLFGVTGSGKTEVYLQAAKTVRDKGENVLILVPEISLTPQMTERFENAFPGEIAVMHSRLTPRQRYDCWEKIRLGKAPIVIGARSAVFMPLVKPALIVIDEEQEDSYQSDMSPRYHAATIARLRSRNEGSVLLLGSATPSLETWQRTLSGKALRLVLHDRPGEAGMPTTEIIDLRSHWNTNTEGLLSLPLIEAMKRAFANGEQALLFLNRRGFASTCLCKSCGDSVSCPSCAIGLTYHKDRGQLICHYCGHTQRIPETCPSCGESEMLLFGAGTQKLQAICESLFPEAEIIRMDQDMTAGSGSHAALLNRFRNAGPAILIGTQMIAKGHDFPRLTVSAVISADQMLARNDLRASESAFQLMTQAAGRAGRNDLPGSVYIQAFAVDHYAVQTAASQDYLAFAEQELAFRKNLAYPPYAALARISISGPEEKDCQAFAQALYQHLKAEIDKKEMKGIEILKPARSSLYKLQNRWRWQMLIKASEPNGIQKLSTLWQQVALVKPDKDIHLGFTLDPA